MADYINRVSKAGTTYDIYSTAVANGDIVLTAEQLANAVSGGVTNVTYANGDFIESIGGNDTVFVTTATLKSDMSLNNVDNTSDLNKPISNATQVALTSITNTMNGYGNIVANNASDFDVAGAAAAVQGATSATVASVESAVGTINTTLSGFGDIVTHNASEFDASGAASAVRGDTTETVASVNTKVSGIQSTMNGFGNIVTHNVSEFDANGAATTAANAVRGNTTETVASVDGKVSDINTTLGTYGNIVTHNASEFDAAGAAASAAEAVQGATDETVASVNTKVGNIQTTLNGFGNIVSHNASEFDASGAAASALADAKTYANGLIDALDVSDTAVGTQYVSAVSESNGKITVTRANLPTSLPASNVTDTYSASGTAPVSGKAIADAFDTLDVSDSAVSGKYVSAVSEANGKISVTRADLPTSLPASDVTNTYSGTGTVPVSGTAVKAAIDALDATKSQTAGADGLALSITETDGKITAISGSIAANTYDASGAAATAKSDVIGTSSDASSANTIYGAKKYTDEKISGLGAFMEFKGTKANATEIKAITSAKKGDVWLSTADSVEWVATANLSSANASAWEKLGYDIDISGKADKATTLSGYGITDAFTKTESNAAANAIAYAAVNTLDVSDSAVTGQYVSKVSETDGKISVTRAKLSDAFATGTTVGAISVNGVNVTVNGYTGHKHSVTPNSMTVSAAASGANVTLNTANAIKTVTKTTKNALGTGATFTTTVTPSTTNIKATASGTALSTNSANGVTAVTIGSSKAALGANATFTTSVTPTTTNIKATASGTAVATGGTATFVKSYPGTTSKLVTTTVTGVSGSTTASKASGGSVTSGTAPSWSASVSNGVLSFSWSAGTTPPVVTLPTFTDVTVPKAATSATTVATGGLNASGGGSSVMTGLGTPTTANAVTSIGTVTNPTIALSTGATAGTGVISVATGITSASTSANSKDTVTAATGLTVTNTTKFLTSASVGTQPTIALATGATAGTGVISVATGISSASTTVNASDTVAAVNGITTTEGTYATGVNTVTQPTIKLNNAASVTVAAATAATTGTPS